MVEERVKYLRLFFENMSELAAIEELVYDESGVAVDWRYLDVNPAFQAAVGKSREQLVGRRASEVWGDGNTPFSFLENFRKAVESGSPVRFEERFGPLGKHFILTVVPLGGSHFTALSTDITERKEMEDALRQSEERYRTIADYTYDWEYWRSPEGEFVYCSPSCERITGYPPEAFISDPDLVDRIIYPEDRERALRRCADTSREPVISQDYRIIRADGAVRWINHVCQSVYDREGRPLGVRASHRDITDRKQFEEYLQRYAAISQHARDIILLLEPDGRILEANKAAELAYGYTSQELQSLNINDLRAEHDAVQANEQMATALREGMLFEIWHRRKDGSTFPVEVNSRGAEIGGRTLLLSVIRDFTQRNQAEEEQKALRRQFQDALEEARREAHRNASLQVVAEAGIAASSFQDLLDTLSRRIVEALDAGASAILLWDLPTGDLVISGSFGGRGMLGHRLGADEGLVGRVRAERRTIHIVDPDPDILRLPGALERPGLVAGTPLIARGRVLGVLGVSWDSRRELSAYDVRLLEAMASRTAVQIDNAQLYDALVASQNGLREALQKEREYSQMLQRALLPRLPRVQEGFRSVAIYAPALAEAEIGGDFYDVFKAGDDWLGVLIGDVSGKGLEAAAMAATTRSTVHAYAHQTSSAGEALTQANAVLMVDQSEFGSFVTVFLAMVNLQTGEFTYSSGGHPPAIIIASDGLLRLLTTGAPPLALTEEQTYPEGVGVLAPGEKLVAYTDGISEARRGREMFEVSGVEETLRQVADAAPNEIAQALMTEATSRAGGRLTDDAAIVVVERLAEGQMGS